MTDAGHSPFSARRLAELNLQQLRSFRQVFELGGYAAASRALHLSVPAVWHHVRVLEQTYGVRLFHRVGRVVRPTDAARRLYDVVDEILVRLESTFDVIQKSDSDGVIRLVTGVRMMLEDLAEPLAAFRRRFANPLVIRNGNNRLAGELLLADEVDLALTLGADFEQSSRLIHTEPAYVVDFLAVCQRNHPLTHARGVSLRELVKHDLIVTARGTHGRDALDHALHREGLQARIVVETDNSGFTIACVQAGMGVGIVAGRPRGQLCRDLWTRPLRRQLGHRQIVFMWRRGRILTEPIRHVIEEVRRLGARPGVSR
jgi:DNA-binding transcriptional LysR family regulator